MQPHSINNEYFVQVLGLNHFVARATEVPVVKHGCIIRSGLLIEISPKDDHATETDDSALPHVLILILLLQKSVQEIIRAHPLALP
jgi:hypothetical protein